MKFGQFTNPYIKTSLVKQVKDICKWADYVEFFIEPPYGTLDDFRKNKKKILEVLTAHNKFAIAHTAWWIDFTSMYEVIRRAWIQEAKDTINLCKEFGIKLLNFHMFSSGGSFQYKTASKIFLANYIKSLKEIVSYGKKQGVEIMTENMPKSSSHTYNFKEYKYVIDRVPGLKVHLDIGHAYTSNGLKEIKMYIDTFKNKLVHVHVSDNMGEEDEHVQIGNGKINYKTVMLHLQKAGYNGTITPEIFEEGEEPEKAAQILKKYLK